MRISDRLKQSPAPGRRLLRFRGDICRFTLSFDGGFTDRPAEGRAFLRTNAGKARIARSEIMASVLSDAPPLARDWHDVPMTRCEGGSFQAVLPLCEVGHFEAKAFFLEDGDDRPVWPPGANTVLNVEPAHTCAANIIYNAFVRQFGPGRTGRKAPDDGRSACIRMLDEAGYTVIPRSGTFRDLIAELDFIVGHLGCRYLQLLPVHPTPTTYARMGRFGSPYAALSFTEVDPAQAEFDPKATPLEQFIELVDAVHARSARIIMDIAINHTGWAASLHETHPQWLSRDAEGRIEMPGAWGVTWADLTKLEYAHRDLWQYMAEVFLTWCRRGVDGFRCDAGYMIPEEAWRFIVARVREQYPDTLFFLEGLGGKISVTRALLNQANLNWAYSELFQNYDRAQLEHYLPGTFEIGETEGLMIHFAETHDNNRLAARSHRYARMRTALCALFSQNGGFGFANGAEWLAEEKINVHESPSLNWGASENQVDHIRRLSAILTRHPAFHDRTELRLIQKGEGSAVVLRRHHVPTGKVLTVAANLDDERETRVFWEACGMRTSGLRDLISGRTVMPEVKSETFSCSLAPGEVLCLSDDPEDLERPELREVPDRVLTQRFQAKALEVFCLFREAADFDPAEAVKRLKDDPVGFCRDCDRSDASGVISWRWPEDVRREVMIPPGFLLAVWAERPFRASIFVHELAVGFDESLPTAGGRHFVLFPPRSAPDNIEPAVLKLSVFYEDGCRHAEAPLLYLPRPDGLKAKTGFTRSEALGRPLLYLAANGRGGMLRAHGAWGRLESRYDALLAANISPDFPEDRRILFTRCRAWIVFQGYSYEIGLDCLKSFGMDARRRGRWRFEVPTGQGENIAFVIGMRMAEKENAVGIVFRREVCGNEAGRLADHQPVRLILRPDIEDRSFHEVAKAFLGPEHDWPRAVSASENGFVFAPSPERRLSVALETGRFVPEPEWQYMVHRPLEAQRGLDADSDLFSPGYFEVFLKGGEAAVLSASVNGEGGDAFGTDGEEIPEEGRDGKTASVPELMKAALGDYVVRRTGLSTVIAGYPWFLDWGRDTLIFARGLLSAGESETVLDIVKQFGRFEDRGTLPNMIRGDDAGDRDTSDAPLWFFAVCAELAAAEGENAVLAERCGGRTLREILISMGRHLKAGTPNGIGADPETGLLFSPSHFTWMDTNYPAGTPRQGYPVEIQALWHFALSYLSKISPDGDREGWTALAERVKAAVSELFFLKDKGYLADCLHAAPGEPAKKAAADDALRPNQLFAITLNALTDGEICGRVLEACSGLLVPGGIRSLADRRYDFPLEIYHHDHLLNDPHRPYRGVYSGDEDTRRKPAYHNGTAWTWVFPSFCEAWYMTYGEAGREAALAWLAGSRKILDSGCIGHLPEILDGDAPHAPRGCDAQAWGASEWLRVWMKLN